MSGVRVSALPPKCMVSLKGDVSTTSVGFAVKKATGLDVPEAGRAVSNEETTAIWMAPDELLILCPRDGVDQVLDKITSAMGDAHFLAADVSDARVVFFLSGEDAMVREVLARLTPADMHPDSFKAGQVRRTRLSQVAGAIWMTEDGAQVLAFRSVAGYVHDLLTNAAASGPVGHF